jgi:tRNA1Val (adenine37-N6)-methyltransferase
MKIGTDGVLLGAWAGTKKPKEVLDIGAGTGLISLMLAQRFPNTQIQAVELDREAYTEAKENVLQSKFNNRIQVRQGDFRTIEFDQHFDLIASNPPFFHQALKSPTQGRNLARHTDTLPLDVLIRKASELLDDNGSLCIIIPKDRENDAMQVANEIGLRPQRLTNVRGRADLPVKRSLMELSRKEGKLITTELVVEVERHVYTEEYKTLTKDFYLNM